MAGYSSTPLAKKLGIKTGMRVLTQGAPAEYSAWLAPLPTAVKLSPRLRGPVDIMHVFTRSAQELEALLPEAIERFAPNGMLWVSWPKKAAKVPTDVTEDTIRALSLPLGLVDVKVCAVSEVWSGLKLVVRKELR